MDIQIGMGCTNQELCDQIGAVLGYSFLGLFIWFVVYVIVKAVKSKK
jgi:hypothetical protein